MSTASPSPAAPRGVDSHFHAYDPVRFPYDMPEGYAPASGVAGTTDELFAQFDANGLSHGLLVTPTVYGTDPSFMLDAIAHSGGRLKGIAVVEEDISEKEIERLAAGGVVGIRINLAHHGLAPLVSPGAPRLFARLKAAGWVLQVHGSKDQWVGALPVLRDCGPRVVLDHCGRPDAALGVSQPGFQAFLEIGRSGNAAVKLSGAFRIARGGPPYADADEYYAAAIEAFTLDNCVWGSDWPFVRSDAAPEYAQTLACLNRWLPDAGDRRKVLWDNPCRLFGFR